MKYLHYSWPFSFSLRHQHNLSGNPIDLTFRTYRLVASKHLHTITYVWAAVTTVTAPMISVIVSSQIHLLYVCPLSILVFLTMSRAILWKYESNRVAFLFLRTPSWFHSYLRTKTNIFTLHSPPWLPSFCLWSPLIYPCSLLQRHRLPAVLPLTYQRCSCPRAFLQLLSLLNHCVLILFFFFSTLIPFYLILQCT